MLGTVVAEVLVPKTAEQHAVMAEKSGLAHLARLGPAGGAIGRDALRLAGAPHGKRNGDHDGRDAAGSGYVSSLDEGVAGIGAAPTPSAVAPRWSDRP
jgi:hypothetical protein